MRPRPFHALLSSLSLPSSGSGRRVRALALLLSAAMAAGALTVVEPNAYAASPAETPASALAREQAARGRLVQPRAGSGQDRPPAPPEYPVPADPVFPPAGRTVVQVGARAKTLPSPVALSPVPGQAGPSQVEVEVLDHATHTRLGARGLAFRLRAVGAAAAAPKAAPRPSVTSGTPSPSASPSVTPSTRTSPTPGPSAARPPAPAAPAAAPARPSAAGGPVTAAVDYHGFAQMFGGDFASRLTLARFPACVLQRPEDLACNRPEFLPVQNNLETNRLGAQLAADGSDQADQGGSVYAVASAPNGGGGDYRATSLAPAGKWGAELNSGSFTHSQPLPLPAGPDGSAPQLALSYNSGSVDGRTSATNNQASWAGLGWDLNPGFIERRYRPCRDIHPAWKITDLCWVGDNSTLSLSLEGRSTELTYGPDPNVPGSAPKIRFVNDPGWQIERLQCGVGNALKHQCWKVTTQSGTQYWFGLGATPVTNRPTNSVFTVSVVGDGVNEPCHGNGTCIQPWRWNLDRVVDPQGSETLFFYEQETNYYKRFSNDEMRQYVRGGNVRTVEYGRQLGKEAEPAPRRAVLDVLYRCAEMTKPCPDFDRGNHKHYPDVPSDLLCSSDKSCPNYTPSFFTGRRLSEIKAQRYDPGRKDWVTTDQLRPSYHFPNPNYDNQQGAKHQDPALFMNWLRRIDPKSGRTLAESAFSTAPEKSTAKLNNRIDYVWDDGETPMVFYRIGKIWTELGSTVTVDYKLNRPCDRNALPGPQSDRNNRDCFSQWFSPGEGKKPKWGWFNKWTVASVRVSDNSGTSPEQVTSYRYEGDPAWHHDNEQEGIRPLTEQSWADWRGYGLVTESTAAADDPGSARVSSHLFFRGMAEDRTASGGSRGTKVRDSEGVELTDGPAVAGLEREVRRFSADGRTELEAEKHEYFSYQTAKNALRERSGHLTVPRLVDSRARTADGSIRRTRASTGHHGPTGLPLWSRDEGDLAVTGDEKCTTTTYAPNTAIGMVDRPARVQTHAGIADDCAGLPVTSRVETLYDNTTTVGAAPTRGNPTEVRSYTKDGEASTVRSEYDDLGRVTKVTDPLGRVTSTEYVPAVGNTVSTKVTNALGHAVTTGYDPDHQLPLTVTDEANKTVTTSEYDVMGRLSKVWLPTEDTRSTPSQEFSYQLPGVGNGVNRITTTRLQAGSVRTTSHTYVDGLGRTIETQAPAQQAGQRTVVATRYGSQGEALAVSAPFGASGEAGSGLVRPKPADIPSETRTRYDSLGRATETQLWSAGALQWTTSRTEYAGDRYTVTPASHGPTTYLTDVYGRVSEVAEPMDDGSTATTRYGYDHGDRLTKVTDAKGNITEYGYDWLGRRTWTRDPDQGEWQTSYDAAGNIRLTRDALKKTVATTYDELNRPTERHQDSDTGPLLARWQYDRAPDGSALPYAIGRATATTGYTDGQAYTSAVSGYDARGRALAKTVTIPAAEKALAGSYTFTYGYDAADHPVSVQHPAVGGLPAETVTTGYDAGGFLTGLTGDIAGTKQTYSSGHVFGSDGKITARVLGSGAHALNRSYTWLAATGQLNSVTTVRAADTKVRHQAETYGYDTDGNALRVTDELTGQRQCFGYDSRSRMTRAWTSGAGDCTGSSSPADRVGPAPYDLRYSYDALGNITSVGEGAAAARAYSYQAEADGRDLPHAVSAVDGQGEYRYNANGQLTGRSSSAGTRVLEWDAQQRLRSVTDEKAGGAKSTSSFVYDPDGQRLVRRTPSARTLYLGGTEVTEAGGKVTGTRYYAAGEATVAMRTPSGLTWLTSDNQGSTSLAVKADTGAVSRQRYSPFGAVRERAGSLGTDRGFLGQVEDADTGLNYLNARYYDASLGRFVSPDPLVDPKAPQTLNGYTYGNNNPATFSDPSGLWSWSGVWNGIKSGAKSFAKTIWHAVVGRKPPGAAVVVRYLQARKPSRASGPRRAHRQHRGWNVTAGAVASLTDDAADFADMGTAYLPSALGLTDFARNTRNSIFDEMGIDRESDEYKAGYWGTTLLLLLSPTPGGKAGAANKGLRLLTKELSKVADEGSDAARLAGRCSSFTAGTAVVMANGTRKAIEDVKVGDQITATNPDTGETKVHPVTALIRTHGLKRLVDINLDTDGLAGDGTGKITATTKHPVWVVGKGWTNAGDLKPGDRLRHTDGTTRRVLATNAYVQQRTVYNLTVANAHTYYVVAGGAPVLVHNSNGDCFGQPGKVVNSNMGHVDLERAQRAGFETVQDAQQGIRNLGESIGAHGFPSGTIRDTARADRVLVPIGSGGYAVYQIKKNGNAVFKTLLTAR